MKLLERDNNQENVPDGCTAFLLRDSRWVAEGGVVIGMSIVNGQLNLSFAPIGKDNEIGTIRKPQFPGEMTRLFVRDDAHVEKAVFDLEADNWL